VHSKNEKAVKRWAARHPALYMEDTSTATGTSSIGTQFKKRMVMAGLLTVTEIVAEATVGEHPAGNVIDEQACIDRATVLYNLQNEYDPK